jgi:hypothetical protein
VSRPTLFRSQNSGTVNAFLGIVAGVPDGVPVDVVVSVMTASSDSNCAADHRHDKSTRQPMGAAHRWRAIADDFVVICLSEKRDPNLAHRNKVERGLGAKIRSLGIGAPFLSERPTIGPILGGQEVEIFEHETVHVCTEFGFQFAEYEAEMAVAFRVSRVLQLA